MQKNIYPHFIFALIVSGLFYTVIHHINDTMYREFALVVSGRVKDWTNSNILNYLPLNTKLPGQIQDGAKPFASEVCKSENNVKQN